MIYLPIEGRHQELDFILDRTLTLRLFSAVSGTTVGESTVYANFVEIDTEGYEEKTLTYANWVYSDDVSGITAAVYDEENPQTWNFTETTTVAGWYVTYLDGATNRVLFAENLVGGAQTFTGSGTFQLIPTRTKGTEAAYTT